MSKISHAVAEKRRRCVLRIHSELRSHSVNWDPPSKEAPFYEQNQPRSGEEASQGVSLYEQN